SLVLFVATAVLWARSLRHFEIIDVRHGRWPRADEMHAWRLEFSWYGGYPGTASTLRSGTLRLELMRETAMPPFFHSIGGGNLYSYREFAPRGLHARFLGDDITCTMNGYPAGFEAGHSPYRQGSPASSADRWVLAFPAWIPPLLTALPPAL